MKLKDLMKEKSRKIWIKCYLKREAKIRPRDPEKEKILIIIDYMRFKRYIKEGKLEIIGDRRYRLKI